MYGQWLHRYLQQFSKELLGRGCRGCLAMYRQWLHRYLQQFCKEIVARESLGRVYRGC
jgi:hypothetical protein